MSDLLKIAIDRLPIEDMDIVCQSLTKLAEHAEELGKNKILVFKAMLNILMLKPSEQKEMSVDKEVKQMLCVFKKTVLSDKAFEKELIKPFQSIRQKMNRYNSLFK